MTGGMKRSPPVGGVAYGTPRNASTAGERVCWPSGEVLEERRTKLPRSEPYLVVTTREDEENEDDDAASVWLRCEVAKDALLLVSSMLNKSR